MELMHFIQSTITEEAADTDHHGRQDYTKSKQTYCFIEQMGLLEEREKKTDGKIKNKQTKKLKRDVSNILGPALYKS